MEILCEEYVDVSYGNFICYSVPNWNISSFKKQKYRHHKNYA